MAQVHKSNLTPQKQQLIELMQQVHFGRIEQLRVCDGEPVFDPPPRVVRQVVFGKANGAHPLRNQESFALKKTVVQLFEVFERERSLLILELVIDNGLPVRMAVADAIRI